MELRMEILEERPVTEETRSVRAKFTTEDGKEIIVENNFHVNLDADEIFELFLPMVKEELDRMRAEEEERKRLEEAKEIRMEPLGKREVKKNVKL